MDPSKTATCQPLIPLLFLPFYPPASSLPHRTPATAELPPPTCRRRQAPIAAILPSSFSPSPSPPPRPPPFPAAPRRQPPRRPPPPFPLLPPPPSSLPAPSPATSPATSPFPPFPAELPLSQPSQPSSPAAAAIRQPRLLPSSPETAPTPPPSASRATLPRQLPASPPQDPAARKPPSPATASSQPQAPTVRPPCLSSCRRRTPAAVTTATSRILARQQPVRGPTATTCDFESFAHQRLRAWIPIHHSHSSSSTWGLLTILILGSSSIYRRQVLADMGYDFRVMTADIDEKAIRKEKPEDLVMAIAEAKADAIVSKLPIRDNQVKDVEPTLLVVADTVVIYEGTVREKPSSKEEARKFMKEYSGGSAQVVSSVVVTNLKTGFRKGEWDRVEISFHEIPDDIIDKLIEEGIVSNVAGGLITEHPLISPYVRKLVGAVDSLMGLPMAITEKLIKESL